MRSVSRTGTVLYNIDAVLMSLNPGRRLPANFFCDVQPLGSFFASQVHQRRVEVDLENPD